MTKSDSSSTVQPARRKPDSLKRSRLLKRGCDFEPLNTDNLRYVWAAYARGCMDKVESLPKGMERDEFVYVFTVMVGKLIDMGGDAFILFGKSPQYGRIGIGVITVARDANKLYPHVLWFPEASMRNKIECVAKFLVEIKKMGLVLIYAIDSEADFFYHLGKYGILRPVGKVRGYFPDGGDSMLFQSVTG